MSRPELVITRGLPASGKTSWARRWVDVDPAGRARINRDDTRVSLHGRYLGTRDQETQTTIVTHGAILDLLRAGVSVVVDDTNLPDRHVTVLWDIADRANATFRVVDFTAVPMQTCVARDAVRPEPARVGRDRIHAMWEQHIQGRTSPLPLPSLVDPVDVVAVPATHLPASTALNPAHSCWLDEWGQFASVYVPGGFWAIKVRPHGGRWIVYAVPRLMTTGSPFLLAVAGDPASAAAFSWQWHAQASASVIRLDRIICAGTGNATHETVPYREQEAWLATVDPATCQRLADFPAGS